MVTVAGACVLWYPQTQASRAGEAELYTMGSGAVESLQLHALMTEQGFSTKNEIPLLRTDSSSGLTLAGRRGQGCLKHVERRLPALQDWAQERSLAMGRVCTEENLSDGLTNLLAKAALVSIMQRLGVGEPGTGN